MKWTILTLGVVLCGCSTTPTDPGDASQATRVVAPVSAAPANASRVIVRRDSGMMGLACNHAVRLDGKLIGSLSTGEEVSTLTTPGEHALEATSSGALCGANAVGGVNFVIAAGQAKTFRTGFSGFFNMEVAQVSETQKPADQPPSPAAQPAQAQAKPATRPQQPAGQYATEAAKVAREQRCATFETAAQFIAKGPGFESYSIPCANGDTMMVRCEFGTCRALR